MLNSDRAELTLFWACRGERETRGEVYGLDIVALIYVHLRTLVTSLLADVTAAFFFCRSSLALSNADCAELTAFCAAVTLDLALGEKAKKKKHRMRK